jgi:hypothetical protein
MEAVRTSETSVDNYFTRQYIPEDNSEHDIELSVRGSLCVSAHWSSSLAQVHRSPFGF